MSLLSLYLFDDFYKTYMNRLFLYTQNYLIQVTLPFLYDNTYLHALSMFFNLHPLFRRPKTKMTKLC